MPNIIPEWYMKILNIEKSWEYSQGYGVIVGLLDSQIEISLNAMIISSIAKGAKYLLSEESDHEFTQIYVIDQIHRSIDKGSHIFCCSKSFRNLEYEKEWEDVIAQAFNNNLIIVAPTGNENKKRINIPAVLEGVISVGSCDEYGRRWSHNPWCGSNYGDKIDCISPAFMMPHGLFGNWRRIDGASLSVANMVGVISLLKSARKDLSFHEIQDLIKQFSSLSVIGWNDRQGWGCPDVFRMLANIVPSDVNTEKLVERLRLISLEIESIISELGGSFA